MQCTVTWSPETGGGLVKPYHPSVAAYRGAKGPVWKDKIMEDEERRERRRRQKEKVVGCCRKVAAFLFSHIGLAAMVVAYSIGGGFLFRALEAPFEVQQKFHIIGERELAVEKILNEAVQLKLNHENANTNFTNKVRAVLLDYQAEVVSAVKDSGWDGTDDTDAIALQWSFAGALLYAVTVITTIGYGHVAPKTEWGRLVTILYALVGIPLTFLYLSNIGNFLADSFRLFYKKVCCDICCCQKCERKKKLERLALRRRRELAAQRNVSMHDPSNVTQYGTNDETLPIQDQMDYYNENEQLGLPGGDENLGFEDDPDEPESEDTREALVSRKLSDKRPNNLRETSFMANNPNIRETDILDDVYEGFDGEVRETDILGDDDDDEKDPPSRKPSKKKKATSPSSDIHVSSGILDKLGNARETDILEDSDDDDTYEKITPNSSQTKSSTDSQLKETGATKGGNKRTKSLKDKTKSKQPKLKEKSKSFKDKSRSKNNESVQGASAVADKESVKRPSKKGRSTDGQTDNENKTHDKDLTMKGSKKEPHTLEVEEPPAYSSHSRSNSKKGKALERGKSSKQSKKLFRKGTSGRKETGEPSLLRKSSTRRKKSSTSESEGDDDDEQKIKQKAFHQSEDSFVTAQGDSLSYLGRLESDDEEEHSDEDEDDEDGLHSNRVMTKSALPSNAVAYDDDDDYDMEMMEFGELGPRQGYAVDDPFDYEAHTDDEKVTVPISICLIIIAGYIFGGSVLFTLWEDWDYLTGSYFCFITLSTIGFGDIVPGTDMKEWSSHSKLVSCSLWLAFGLSLLAMCFNLMQEEVKEKCKWLGQKLGLLKDDGEG